MSKQYNPLDHSIVQALMKADACNRYECSDYVEALIRSLRDELERVYWNWNQKKLEDHDWQFLEIDGLAYRRYSYSDCDCGAESPIHLKNCDLTVKHGEWNSRRLHFLSDPHPEGPPTDEEIKKCRAEGKDPVFEFIQRFSRTLDFSEARESAFQAIDPRPECSCGAEDSWTESDHHLETCSPTLPNWSFEDVRINWYKRIGRGMSVNMDWSEKQWREWYDRCMAAIRLYDSCHRCFGTGPNDGRKQLKDCPHGAPDEKDS